MQAGACSLSQLLNNGQKQDQKERQGGDRGSEGDGDARRHNFRNLVVCEGALLLYLVGALEVVEDGPARVDLALARVLEVEATLQVATQPVATQIRSQQRGGLVIPRRLAPLLLLLLLLLSWLPRLLALLLLHALAQPLQERSHGAFLSVAWALV
jgi:hypothetical protein